MDKRLLKQALDELYRKAEEAAGKDEIPISAMLLFPDGTSYLEANAVEKENDPLAHAEMRVIQKAMKSRGRYLKDAVLLVSLEPCLMCLGAILKAGIPELWYVLDDPKLGSLSHYHAFVDDVLRVHRVEDERFEVLMKKTFSRLRKG